MLNIFSIYEKIDEQIHGLVFFNRLRIQTDSTTLCSFQRFTTKCKVMHLSYTFFVFSLLANIIWKAKSLFFCVFNSVNNIIFYFKTYIRSTLTLGKIENKTTNIFSRLKKSYKYRNLFIYWEQIIDYNAL